jgi:hypothetical protein
MPAGTVYSTRFTLVSTEANSTGNPTRTEDIPSEVPASAPATPWDLDHTISASARTLIPLLTDRQT